MDSATPWQSAVASSAAMVRTSLTCYACQTLESAWERYREISDEWAEILLPNPPCAAQRYNADSRVLAREES